MPNDELRWSINKPTTPGWYWWRYDDKPVVMFVDDRLQAAPHAFPMKYAVATMGGEWSSSPLAPPEEPKEEK